MPAKNPFGDCGGNITDSENGFIKSPNYPEKYTTNDQSEYITNIQNISTRYNVNLDEENRGKSFFCGEIISIFGGVKMVRCSFGKKTFIVLEVPTDKTINPRFSFNIHLSSV